MATLFKFVRTIVDIYVSRKRRKSSINPFAFVRYASTSGALRTISCIKRMVTRRNNIMVKEAKFKMGDYGI